MKDKHKLLPDHGSHISSEDKILYKEEDVKGNDQVKEPESKHTLDKTEGISYSLLIYVIIAFL